jgi:hypothetical protein
MFLLQSNANEVTGRFLDQRERWPYLLVFVGLLLTAFGSYLLSPVPKQFTAGMGQAAEGLIRL